MARKHKKDVEITLGMIDRFSRPMKRFNSMMGRLTAPVKVLRNDMRTLGRLAGFEKAAGQARRLRSRLGNVGREAAAVGRRLAFIGAGGAAALGAIVSSTARSGDAIAKTSMRLGLAVEAYQELAYAADQAGISQQTFDMAFQRFGRRAAEAANGTGEAKDALKALGIQLKDSAGQIRPVEDLFMDVVENMSRIKDPIDRNRVAMKLFDSEGVKLVQMLQGGRDALMDARKEAHKYGAVISEEAAKASEDFIAEQTRLQRALRGVKDLIGVTLMPQVTELMKQAAGFLVSRQEQIGEFARSFAEKLPGRIKAVRKEFGRVYEKIKPVIDVIAKVVEAVGPANSALGLLAVIIGGKLIAAVGGLMSAFVGLNAMLVMTPIGWIIIGITAAVAGLAAGAIYLYRNWEKVGPYLSGLWERIKESWDAFFGVVKPLWEWSPLGQIVSNWGPITEWFRRHSDSITAILNMAWDGIKFLFDWSPLGLIIRHWDPIVGWFKKHTESIKTVLAPAIEWMRVLFDWSPLTLLVRYWDPITEFFRDLWGRIESIFESGWKTIERITSGIGKLIDLIPGFSKEDEGSSVAKAGKSHKGAPRAALDTGGGRMLGAADVVHNIRERRTYQRNDAEVTVNFKNTPPGTRTDVRGSAPVDVRQTVDMGQTSYGY